jgi:hypothetical protein
MAIPHPSHFLKCFIPLALLIMSVPGSAAVFNVTSSWCTGPNSIVEAIDNANASPGVDTISIQAGLAIQFRTCPITNKAAYAGYVQESVIIEGNGATLQGDQSWVSLGGVLNPEGCPSKISGVIIVNTSPGFLSIGNKRADNSAIKVIVNNLTASDLSAFAQVYEAAQLEVNDVHLIDIQDALGSCSRSAIDGYQGSSISIVDSTVYNFRNYGNSLLKNIWNATLANYDGSVYVRGSHFSKGVAGIPGGALISTSSDVTVVSSRFENAGGFSFLGSADAPTQVSIVNSAIQIFGAPETTDRIYASFYSDVDIKASTIVSIFGTTATGPPGDSKTMPLYAEGGTFHLSETAIGVWGDAIPGALLFADGGGYTADPLTYVQPIAGQDAASLRLLTGQPALLTDPPALPGEATGLTLGTAADLVEWITPIATGVLIDQVVDAGAGGINQLRDPFDGTVITKDVFGNDRVDANGNRNIGAVQLSLAPSLHAVGGDTTITLDWTRPQEPNTGSIQGYDLCWVETGVACTLWIPVSLDPDVLTVPVTGLTNGTSYDFIVRARYGPALIGPYGPESNLVTETPFGAVETPVLSAVPGDGEVTLNWTRPADGGHGLLGYATWFRLAGSLDWIPWSFVQGGDTLQTTVTGLTNGVEWEFSMRAVTPDSISSDMTTAAATPWPIANLAYASPVTLSENSIVSVSPSVSNLVQTPVYILYSGTLPAGLTLDSATGLISGTTEAGSAGTYNVTVLLSQAGLPSVFDVTANVEIQVFASEQDLYLRYADIDVATGAGPLEVTPTVTGTQAGTLSFAMVPGDVLPAGLSLDPLTGRITGVPTIATNGFQGLSVEVTEQLGQGSQIAVSPLVVRIRPTLEYDPADAEVGDFIAITPDVSPSATPGSFTLDDGNMPAGLSLDAATGIISGIPELPEFAILTITFTMTGGQQEKVSAVLGISVTNYTINLSYADTDINTQSFITLPPTVSGLKGAAEYRVVSGVLPVGLSLDPLTGVISGKPSTNAPPGPIIIEVVDAYNSAQALVNLNMTLAAAAAVPTLSQVGLLVLIGLLLMFALIWFKGRRKLTH